MITVIKNPKITQNFTKSHFGLDLISKTNERNIYTPADGKIINRLYKESNIGGNELWIEHGNGYITRYCHLKDNSINHKIGDYVSRGTIIGIEGDTGNATGVHLHFEIWKDKKYNYINPYSYIFGDDTIPDLSINTNSGKVIVNGQLHSDSYGSRPGKTLHNYSGVITKTVDLSRPYPYLIDNLGWVNGDSIGTINIKRTFNVGDSVTLNGRVCANSYGDNPGKTFVNTKGTITRIVDKTRSHPYLINNWGWVKESDIQ